MVEPRAVVRALIVSAHPEPSSFHASLREAAVEELGTQGYEVQVSDLYAMGFKAVLDREDFPGYEDERLNVSRAQRQAWKNKTLAPDIATELERLLSADLLLLMFPLWWFGMPAILKGWIDRVFLSGVVYGRTAVFERGRMFGKRAFVATSTGSPSESFGPGSLNGDVADILMPLHRGVLGFTGMTVLPPFVAYHVPYVGPEGRSDLLVGWRHHLRKLDTMSPIEMPRLADHLHALAAESKAY